MITLEQDTQTGPLDDEQPVVTERHGRYEVVRRLGAGGMGIVLEARDPVLHRSVALKLLRPRRNWSSVGGSARLVFEAQAMARLAHPNVVTVFEVDSAGDQVYVAMELVAGTTLRGWQRARPRTWREIVEIYVDAGRGLAAAHAAGLVHRDFKPDNVLIGSDGRPRVSDFGLVVETGADDAEVTEVAALDGEATLRGSAAGTPAYMSAEQWAGKRVDARSDQFAFCVGLWEAICGRRPFAGARPSEYRDAVRAGMIADPPSDVAPRWLLAMLRRGLSLDPAARWPSMTTLLDAIVRRLAVRRGRAIVAITLGIATASAVAAAAFVQVRDAPDPCASPIERLVGIWNPVRSSVLGARLTAVDAMQGASRYARIASALDSGARGWSAMHVDACLATRVEGRQSDTLLDRRMACLDRWLAELGDTIAVIAQASTPAEVDRSVRAATSLSPLDDCADVRALTDAPAPAGAADRATAGFLADRIRELDVAQRAGRVNGLTTKAAAVVAAARALGHAPTLSDALAVQAKVMIPAGHEPALEPVLRELVQVAARVHHDRDEAFGWLNLLMSIANEQGKIDEALALVLSARAAVARAGDPIDLRVDLLYFHASVLDLGPRSAEALVLLEEARQLLERAGASSPTSPLASRLGDVMFEVGGAQMHDGDYDASIASYRQAIERWRAISGVDSIDESFGLHNLGASLQRAGRLEEALTAAREAVRIREARMGDSTQLALSLTSLASILDDLQRWDQSIPIYARALQVARATRAPGDLTPATTLIGRGVALVRRGRLDEAARDFDEAVGLFEAAGAKTSNLAIALYNRGDVAARRGRCDDAIRDHSRTTALFEELFEPTSHYLIYPLSGNGACLVRLGRPAEAIPLLERALRCKVDPGDGFEVARARAYLGRARVETGRDVTGGLALVRAARPVIAGSPEGKDDVPLIDRWLAAHAR